MNNGTKVNVELQITSSERRRIVLEYLRDTFMLDYRWEGNDIVAYENCYHNDVCREVKGKVTPMHTTAKELYEYITEKK